MNLAYRAILLAMAGTGMIGAMPASAAAVLGATACSNTDVTPTATACSGWYEGNLNSGNATDLADEAAIVNSLLGTSYTGATLPYLDVSNLVGNTITFASALTGTVILGVHVGAATGAGGIGYNGTSFYTLVDPGSSVTMNVPGLSNARIFGVAAVPEPGTWAMMLVGLGLVGWTLRKYRRSITGPVKTTVTFGGLSQPA
jgi:hypothetical protein